MNTHIDARTALTLRLSHIRLAHEAGNYDEVRRLMLNLPSLVDAASPTGAKAIAEDR